MEPGPRSDRTTVKRKPGRGVYDLAAVRAIFDKAVTCTVAFTEGEQPFAIPIVHGRIGSRLFFHGAPANRTLGALAAGAPCCVTAAIVDGIVLGRTAKKHSLNYRAAMVLGVAREVQDPEDKTEALTAIIEHMLPGRSAEVAPPDEGELRSTTVLTVPIDEASAKVRSGDPSDPPANLHLPVWAGQLPLRLAADAPIPDSKLTPGRPPPDHLLSWNRDK